MTVALATTARFIVGLDIREHSRVHFTKVSVLVSSFFKRS